MIKKIDIDIHSGKKNAILVNMVSTFSLHTHFGTKVRFRESSEYFPTQIQTKNQLYGRC